MDTRKIANDYRLQQWAEIIVARNESGKSIKDFCRDTGVSRNAYYYWQRKLREIACKDLIEAEETKGVVPNGWLMLKSTKPQYTDNLSIEINGCSITVKSDTDPELLKNVCSVLRSL